MSLQAIVHWDNSHFVVVYNVNCGRLKDNNVEAKSGKTKVKGITPNGTLYVADPAKGSKLDFKYESKDAAEIITNDRG